MQTFKRNLRNSIIFEEIETNEATNCLQIREWLDALFGDGVSLEEIPARKKRCLFKHLENCRDCCRSFDVRARFRSPGRNKIY